MCKDDYYEPWNNHSVLVLTDAPDYSVFLREVENYSVAECNKFCKNVMSGCRYHIVLYFTEPVDLCKYFGKVSEKYIIKYMFLKNVSCMYSHLIDDSLIDYRGHVATCLFSKFRESNFFQMFRSLLQL